MNALYQVLAQIYGNYAGFECFFYLQLHKCRILEGLSSWSSAGEMHIIHKQNKVDKMTDLFVAYVNYSTNTKSSV